MHFIHSASLLEIYVVCFLGAISNFSITFLTSENGATHTFTWSCTYYTLQFDMTVVFFVNIMFVRAYVLLLMFTSLHQFLFYMSLHAISLLHLAKTNRTLLK